MNIFRFFSISQLTLGLLIVALGLSISVPSFADSVKLTSNLKSETPISTSAGAPDLNADGEEDDNDDCSSNGFLPFLQSLNDLQSPPET